MRVQIKATVFDPALREKVATALTYVGFDASILGADVYGVYEGELHESVLSQLRITADSEQKDRNQRMIDSCIYGCSNCKCWHD